MKFGYIGINYKQAKQDVRDKTAFTDQKKIAFLEKARDFGVEQCMVLSTCNRSEVFFFYEQEGQIPQQGALERMETLYQDTFPEAGLEGCLDSKTGDEAYRYLFRITAGLESLVLGEDQILGQVKEAHEFARAFGSSKKELNKVVREAVTCAKRIKTELKISETPLSVCYAGIQQIEKEFGIKGKRALVIGSGKTAELALKYLEEYQAGQIWMCNRTFSHAKRLQEEYPNLQVLNYENRYQAIENCDLILSATASPHLVIKKEAVQISHKTVFLDLASPRDIDSRLGENELVSLIDMDVLDRMIADNWEERQRLAAQSDIWIRECIEELKGWLLESGVDSTIESLTRKCDEIVEDSFSYLDRKLDLSEREQKIVKKMLAASLKRLLREPILELKHLDTVESQQEYQKVVRKLFQI